MKRLLKFNSQFIYWEKSSTYKYINLLKECFPAVSETLQIFKNNTTENIISNRFYPIFTTNYGNPINNLLIRMINKPPKGNYIIYILDLDIFSYLIYL